MFAKFYYKVPLLSLAALLLSACATGPKYATDDVELSLTPKQVTAEAERHQGKKVLWGGRIINSTNLASRTRLEVLGYPLDSNQRPQLDESPYGRFLVFKEGYLETVDYAAGRRITILGPLSGSQEGQVDESRYLYPVVDAEQLYLWPLQAPRSEPRVQFGIGVIFGR